MGIVNKLQTILDKIDEVLLKIPQAQIALTDFSTFLDTV